MRVWKPSTKSVLSRKLGLVACLLVGCNGMDLAIAAEPAAAIVSKVDYSRDIRPILAQQCWNCHGPDEASRKAEFRLDQRESALAKKAIVPGDLAASQLVARISSTDADEQMPPPDFKKPLNERQKELLKAWISQGAAYSQHWAFIAPQKPAVPQVVNASLRNWPKNAIDNFVLSRLEQERLHPSPAADKSTLLRRVHLDLTGLPPSAEEVTAFLADDSPQAYERVVDQLLASPRYAERMASSWLDAARYADTNGYNNDEDRQMWPWRDWVLQSFQKNQPYDQFIVEQLAGDLLPGSTQPQKIATGFHRNQGHNTEGGIIQEEYRVEYVADRVHTTATIFLGLSMQCARCHDHKFDPLTQQEYYKFYGFFNTMEEKQAGYSNFSAAEPFIKVPTAEQQAKLAELESQKADFTKRREERVSNAPAALATWEQAQTPESLAKFTSTSSAYHFACDEVEANVLHDSVGAARTGTISGKANWTTGKVGGALHFDGKTFADLGQVAAWEGSEAFSISVWVNPSASENMAILSKMDEGASFRGYDLLLEGGNVTSHLIQHWADDGLKVVAKTPLALNTWQHVLLTYDGSRKGAGIKLFVDGKPVELDIPTDKLSGSIATDQPLRLGKRQNTLLFKGSLDDLQIFRQQLTAENATELAAGKSVTNLAQLLSTPVTERSEAQKQQLAQFFLDKLDPEYQRLQTALAENARLRAETEKQLLPVMVLQEMAQPRETFVLKRGEYNQPSDKVAAGVPAFLPALPPPAQQPSAAYNRLHMAQWLVSPQHPLTARVAVNRWWQMLFGTGIVRTVEDFGTTGEYPSHPELLDYLATQLIESGWDVKAMQKMLVMSATYQQSSKLSAELAECDPENRLLARGARFRWPAEVVRDNALAISGLLKERQGGPSVKPYQPAGLWEDVSVERKAKYAADQGEGLYRRSLYTFWKRTCPPPALTTFDAPNREVCLARRARTNTPLQALILLNDPTYVEAARKFAERAMDSGTEPKARLEQAFRLALARSPSPAEEAILLKIYANAHARFTKEPAKAEQLLAVGSQPKIASVDSIDLAAWTTVCSTILNLDETISKR